MRRPATLLLLAVAPFASPLLPHPASAEPANGVALAAHHAVYKLSLARATAGNVVAAAGTMVYDVTDACTGWTTSERLELSVINRDGQNIQMASDYATWETKDGTRLDFHTRQLTDTAVTEEVAGEASLQHAGGPGTVRYTDPQNKSVALPPGTLLPMAHTAAIIAAAEQGKRFFSAPLFDGTGASGAEDTFVIIEGWHQPEPNRWPALASLPFGRVHIAFFDRSAGATTPDYETGIRYYANGVADDLSMNFGDFVMAGQLRSFKLAPPPHC